MNLVFNFDIFYIFDISPLWRNQCGDIQWEFEAWEAWGEQIYGRTDGQKDVWKFTPVSYVTSALWGRCPKKWQKTAFKILFCVWGGEGQRSVGGAGRVTCLICPWISFRFPTPKSPKFVTKVTKMTKSWLFFTCFLSFPLIFEALPNLYALTYWHADCTIG